MSVRARGLAIAVLIALLAASVGFAVVIGAHSLFAPAAQQPSSRPSGAHSTNPNRSKESCVAKADSTLTATDLPGMQPFIASTMDTSPVRTGPAFLEPPLSVQTFVVGRLVGFVASEAWREPYIGESQADQRRLGYKVTTSPQLPLHGRIVLDHPELLEVYQMDTEYSSHGGAESFQGTETTAPPDPTIDKISLPPPLTGVVLNRIASDSPESETKFHADLVETTYQLDFYFQGGAKISDSEIAKLLLLAIDRFNSSCHLPSLNA